MDSLSRRECLQGIATLVAGAGATLSARRGLAQAHGDRPLQMEGVKVLNPRNRVPLSFIIDDSTCLVNLAHFGIPQFHETFPDRYRQPWRELPREIPDAFVRKFARWCREQGVKGKYSIVPYPACVGWVDRYMPGWSHQALRDSLKLVREEIVPDWDIHPEMVSHTRVIDTKTGRPFENSSEYFMENWRWTDGKSVDELANYLAYALRMLKNAGLFCEGITTPGGFGNRVLPELAQATLESCRDVYSAEIPHYFRHLYIDERSVAPRVEYASGLDGDDPRCVGSIIGCTGDWFGGWDGLVPGSVERLITADLKGGRMPEIIRRGEPAIMVCHWPGIYYNGEEIGFNIFKKAVHRLHDGYDNLIWMKLSEIARYWAAKELTGIARDGDRVTFQAPFESPWYTVQISGRAKRPPRLQVGGETKVLAEVNDPLKLRSGSWVNERQSTIVCFDLPKGESAIVL